MKLTQQKAIGSFGLLALLATPSTAWAHIQAGEAEGFLSGVHHPISGWDHVLAMVAVGLWGAQLGAPAVWLLPITFPMVMALGAMMGLLGIPLPGVVPWCSPRNARPCGSGRASSDSLPSSTGTHMARNCRPAKTVSSTAQVS